METDSLLIYCSCPDRETADVIAKRLVADHLAACVNILENVSSVYRWEGEVKQDQECLLLIKTDRAQYGELEAAILDQHPYEVPEIIAVRIDLGAPDYLAWLRENTIR